MLECVDRPLRDFPAVRENPPKTLASRVLHYCIHILGLPEAATLPAAQTFKESLSVGNNRTRKPAQTRQTGNATRHNQLADSVAPRSEF
jgi:hypothetical protein